jgi:outer membrane lipoprotein-sorting protein
MNRSISSRMIAAWYGIVLSATLVYAQAPASGNARQIMEEVQRRQKSVSQHYEGTLEVTSGGKHLATKQWTFERFGSSGNSKAMLRFVAPAEVKGVALLIVNHPDRASDQWIWRPAIGREQRIALQDRSTRFFGTDFSFEDLEERDIDQYEFKIDSEDNSAWKIHAAPRKASQYINSVFWVDKNQYTITKAELYDKKGLVRTIDYRDFDQVDGIHTPRTTEVHDITRDSRTILRYDQLQFNKPLKDSEFTLDALRRGL